ncbi:MAG: hypothetical protein H6732_07855 [Alphaproteobacteria bacterium]|nr:hypothetical protein [Alphaproteobacteria bacterium]
MDVFLNGLGIVSLSGLICTGIFSALFGGMPLLLLVGMIDGPRGGRLEERARARAAR